MTRINTNVSSLNAQKSLARSNMQLQQALTRLSTGLRINVGKDDPAGLIASEALRSDIISVQVAVSNSERANQMIATADSSLGQISSLLNDIRGLVTEAANSGAMSDEQLAANQLQVDSSLEAINRIAQTTTFQGKKLLNGSLGFITSATQNFANIGDLEINQANLGAADQIDVEIEIADAATKAQISSTINADTNAKATLSFAAGATVTLANTGGAFEVRSTSLGTSADGVAISFVDNTLDNGLVTSAVYTPGVSLVITGDFVAGGTANPTIGDIVDKIKEDNPLLLDAEASAVDRLLEFDNGDIAVTAEMGIATLQIEADTAGADFNNLAISLTTATAIGAANPTAVYDPDANTLVITIDDDESTTLAKIEEKILAIANASFTATVNTEDGDARLTISGDGGEDSVDAGATANTVYSGGGVLEDSVVFELAGSKGVEVFNFQKYTKISAVAAAINLVSDALGVDATDNAGTLELDASEYGSAKFVAVSVISEGISGTFETNLTAARAIGTNIDATVNGFAASGDGNTLSINTATLDLSAAIAAGTTDTIQFSITGGGAMFQIGPDVVSVQQARLGIQSVAVAQLRGESGRLYQLGSGESAALDADPTTAASIVDEIISEVASLRGRLGAFQKTTLESNINSLNDTLETLTAAESSIRDADFAAESANLTRAQILVQSGISVLAIANSNPQSILALLR
ncbi:MAG TPA: flagellin [Thermoguttaceae bacterium]|nr:flagellin [Thermoguttaceae bacterium]